jgi:hypothetical protein
MPRFGPAEVRPPLAKLPPRCAHSICSRGTPGPIPTSKCPSCALKRRLASSRRHLRPGKPQKQNTLDTVAALQWRLLQTASNPSAGAIRTPEISGAGRRSTALPGAHAIHCRKIYTAKGEQIDGRRETSYSPEIRSDVSSNTCGGEACGHAASALTIGHRFLRYAISISRLNACVNVFGSFIVDKKHVQRVRVNNMQVSLVRPRCCLAPMYSQLRL